MEDVDFPEQDSDCYFSVGDYVFDNDTFIRNISAMYILSNETIELPISNSSCIINITYAAVEPGEALRVSFNNQIIIRFIFNLYKCYMGIFSQLNIYTACLPPNK